MQKTAARSAAVFPIFPKNQLEWSKWPPTRAKVKCWVHNVCIFVFISLSCHFHVLSCQCVCMLCLCKCLVNLDEIRISYKRKAGSCDKKRANISYWFYCLVGWGGPPPPREISVQNLAEMVTSISIWVTCLWSGLIKDFWSIPLVKLFGVLYTTKQHSSCRFL